MRIHVIACQVFSREFSHYIARSDNIIDVTWLPQGLHNTPDLLRRTVADAIEAACQSRCLPGDPAGYARPAPDAVALGYGLCGGGTAGLTAPSVPLVIPKTDDCIAIFLGSQARYMELFEKNSGTYWLNNGWIESAFIPVPERYAALRATYAELYGEDNADYLTEQELLWAKKYNRCGYIRSELYENAEYSALARRAAEYHGWEYAEESADDSMIRRLLDGKWDGGEFLVCPPGWTVEATFGSDKIRAVPPGTR